MPMLDDMAVDCGPLVIEPVESSVVRGGVEFFIDAEGANKLHPRYAARDTLMYEGPILLRGERFRARVPVSIFAFNPAGFGGALVRIAASGPLERVAS